MRLLLVPFAFLLYISFSLLPATCALQVPVHLNAENFEHNTQASTGQTTGIWYIIFSSKLNPEHQTIVEAWRSVALASMEELPNVIWAKVYSEESHSLLHRLKVTELPAVYLFRDQKMYIYGGKLEGGDFETIPQLRYFLKEGYLTTLGLKVPKELTYFDTLKSQVQDEIDKMTRTDKIMLGVGLTAFVLSLVVLACKWYSDMKSPPMQPQPMFADNTKGPPSKQPQTGQNKKNKKNT